MAAGTFTFYDSASKIFFGGADLTDATIIVSLHTNSYVPSAAHDERADLTNEISATFGYTSYAKTLGSPLLTAITNGFKFSSGNAVWTAAGGAIVAWRYAVFSITGTVESLSNPLIGYFLGDVTPADVPATTDTNTLTLTCPAGGWFDMTHA